MATRADNPPVIAIVGETASGKTSLALALAQQFNGEIIAADSRTVYKGMDIGTAKPTKEEQALVPHHLLDVVTPDQHFTVAEFQRLAEQAITDIAARGRVPFLVGGSGLYVDAVMYGFSLRSPADPSVREALQKKTIEELQEMIIEQGIPMPENVRNPRHLVRALETRGELPSRSALRPNGLILGLQADREALKANITARVDAMIEAGFLDEIRKLVARYGWDAPGLQAPGYKAFRPYFEGMVSLDEAKAQFVQNDLQLAKRQRTWFKRNSDIKYLSKKADFVALITTHLNNCYTASQASLLQ